MEGLGKKIAIYGGIAFVAFIIIVSIMFGTASSEDGGDSTSAYDMSDIQNSDYIVKIDEKGALPALNKKQLTKAFKKGYSTNQQLLKHVDDFITMQDKYNVNAVFAAAVSVKETTAGTLGHGAESDECQCHNWFNYSAINNMKEGKAGWAKWDTASEGIIHFGEYIAEHSECYFSQGDYTVDKISVKYCPPGDTWAAAVKGYIDDFYKAAGVEVATEYSFSESGNTVTINGRTFHNYSQGDYNTTPPWYRATPEPWGTISAKGCMPSSMAIIASGYNKKSKNGKVYNPATFVSEVLPGNNGNKTNGSSYSTFANASTYFKKIGLRSGELRYTSNSSTKKALLKALSNGKTALVHASSGRYTSYGHFMAIIGRQGNTNKVYLSNPSSSCEDGWYDYDYIVSGNVDQLMIVGE